MTCPDCHDTGKITLLTSVVECDCVKRRRPPLARGGIVRSTRTVGMAPEVFLPRECKFDFSGARTGRHSMNGDKSIEDCRDRFSNIGNRFDPPPIVGKASAFFPDEEGKIRESLDRGQCQLDNWISNLVASCINKMMEPIERQLSAELGENPTTEQIEEWNRKNRLVSQGGVLRIERRES